MRIMSAFLCSVIFTLSIMSQSDPGCSNLSVENISINSGTGQINIGLKNDCANCTSGLNGCVYWEMEIIRTVSPFDTLASSNCFCLQTPDNNTVKQYVLSTAISVLPPLHTLRVSFKCGVVGCDSLPPSTALSIPVFQDQVPLLIMPNPIEDQLFIQLQSNKELDLEVLDVQGKMLMQHRVDGIQKILNFSTLENGFYIIQVRDINGKILKQFKVTKV